MERYRSPRLPRQRLRRTDYADHRLSAVVGGLSKYALALAAVVLVLYFFISRRVYAHVSTILLTVFDIVGLYFSYLLMQKSLHIHTAASDRVCGVLEKGGATPSWI